jgi:hypothetical protein
MDSLHARVSVRARVWWARVSLGLAVLTAVVLLAFAGPRSVWLVLLTAAFTLVVVAAGILVPAAPRRAALASALTTNLAGEADAGAWPNA